MRIDGPKICFVLCCFVLFCFAEIYTHLFCLFCPLSVVVMDFGFH